MYPIHVYKTHSSNTPKLKPLLVLKQKHKNVMQCNVMKLIYMPTTPTVMTETSLFNRP